MAAKKQRKTAGVVRRHVRALDRQKAVLDAILDGATLEEAAERAGYAGKQGAQQARDSAIAKLEAKVADVAEAFRRQSEERLARGLKAIWRFVKKGDLAAIDRWLRIEARWSKLRGGDAPKKLEHAGPGGGPVRVDVHEQLLAQLAGRADGEPSAEGAGGGDPEPDGGAG